MLHTLMSVEICWLIEIFYTIGGKKTDNDKKKNQQQQQLLSLTSHY